MARPKDVKRPIHRDYTCSEDEKYNLDILTKYYNSIGDRIYPARIINHLVHDECMRLGLNPKPCIENTLMREKENKQVEKNKLKKVIKKLTKKQQEEKELEERLFEILG